MTTSERVSMGVFVGKLVQKVNEMLECMKQVRGLIEPDVEDTCATTCEPDLKRFVVLILLHNSTFSDLAPCPSMSTFGSELMRER